MSSTVIRVENLTKEYVLGNHGKGEGLRHIIHDLVMMPFRRLKNSGARPGKAAPPGQAEPANAKSFLALNDVSFEIKQGEVVGIIGRNGAGKSTLLKILSRITEPTSGRVEIKGRVASLLEVGTGFHPELTGRENIFLNGSILGMSRVEIKKKFDEIVAFAEVEKFLDTPVKRYSSGMYVRLAFAVAAHLEPEILIVDEVLAVGDVQFQKKCLGKMQDVAQRQGRTVLFVSHNMDAILRLCSRGILMASGKIQRNGTAAEVADTYLEGQLSLGTLINLDKIPRTVEINGKARLAGLMPGAEKQNWSFAFGEGLAFDFEIESQRAFDNIEIGVGLFSSRGFEVASWTNTYAKTILELKPGSNKIRLNYKDLTLVPGQYYIGVGLRSERGLEDYIPEAVRFEVLINKDSSEANTHTFGGVIVPVVEAHLVSSPAWNSSLLQAEKRI